MTPYTNLKLITQQVQKDAAFYSFLIKTAIDGAQTYLDDLRAFRKVLENSAASAVLGAFPGLAALPSPPEAVPPGLWKRTRDLISRIRKHPGYTEAIGQALDIIPKAAPVVTQATIKKLIALTNHQVQIEFAKGAYSGVLIESRRNGETAWTPLDKALASPYVDTRPPLTAGQVEHREYCIRYLKGNEPIGEWSAVEGISTRA